VLSWYVAPLFSEWFWDCSSCPCYYWYHFCFYVPRAPYSCYLSSLYFRIFSASFLITLLLLLLVCTSTIACVTCRGTTVPLLLSKKRHKLNTGNTSVTTLTGCQLITCSYSGVVRRLFVVSYTLGQIWSAIVNEEIVISLGATTDRYSGVNLRPWLWVEVSYLRAKLAENMFRPCLKLKFLSLCTGHPLPIVHLVTNLGSVMDSSN
jgi:hypothetical protein